jgi:transcriptional regulator with PAS, ATPase and Fis domain
MDIQSVKQRFSIIGNNELLNRALETALRVASTDLSVLVTGESGVGKESIPQIIHAFSTRKHHKYIAVNCGAIPSGTMDSELFGHVKGSFTGAQNERKGYFEEADGGSIFLDEVAEMPLETQVKLLRLLETGEYIKVGASQVQKTNVRIIAATNVHLLKAIEKGKFREDLYYRLNTVPIELPPLRKRKEDIHILFRKFASDFAEKYRMPIIRLTESAIPLLENYYWNGNIRQLKNITEQLSILEQERDISPATLQRYLPDLNERNLPATLQKDENGFPEKEILVKIMYDMKKEVDDLKRIVGTLIQKGKLNENELRDISAAFEEHNAGNAMTDNYYPTSTKAEPVNIQFPDDEIYEHEEVEETLSLIDKEKELIQKALEKYRGKRKAAASELGISERTLYRKIKEYDLA